jgi:hypothetical protein
MKLTKGNIIFLTIDLIIIVSLLLLAYNTGCSPYSMCMGPRQIDIMGIPFNSNITIILFFPLILSLVPGFIAATLTYKLKKESFDQSINQLIKVFSISLIILVILASVLMSFMIY